MHKFKKEKVPQIKYSIQYSSVLVWFLIYLSERKKNLKIFRQIIKIILLSSSLYYYPFA